MTAKTLMVMGTGSSVGKSLLVTALCRLFARSGVRVAPFKAQNMSNNAAVCRCGAEIGRAQAVQAQAAGLEPRPDMNPVLLKPEGHTRSQVIVEGRPWATLQAARFYERKSALWPIVTAALERLRGEFDLVVIEGAGSPVELNLKTGDIVNMTIARHAQSPVLLVGDIDKGGIFAQLLGTLWLLSTEERALMRGLIVNKFRGDPALFTDGRAILTERGQVPVIGVVPFIEDLAIPEEDAVALDGPRIVAGKGTVWDIAVVHLPHIANFDDFDPLATEPGVRLRYVKSRRDLGRPDALILPGSKSTLADLAWLHERGFAKAIQALAPRGAAIVGICGGLQMLGELVRDPGHVEATTDQVPGLGLLPLETVFVAAKQTRQVSATVVPSPGWLAPLAGYELQGYEIHMGRTFGGRTWLRSHVAGQADQHDGAMSPDGQIWGCYLHGIFANDKFRAAWLGSLGKDRPALHKHDIDMEIDRLADVVEAALDIDFLREMVGL